MEYRVLQLQDLPDGLLDRFDRRQAVTDCLRRENGAWAVRSAPFCDDWDEAERDEMLGALRRTVRTGGFVAGAFEGGALVGFVSLERAPMGSGGQYRDLSQLYVSAGQRRSGIGRALFRRAAEQARADGARKLYISAHSAVETQRFYRAMGCVEAREYDAAHVAAEPYDCQMEYVL